MLTLGSQCRSPQAVTLAALCYAALRCAVQALDEDQQGEAVEWRRVFEEDREFNQGVWLAGRVAV